MNSITTNPKSSINNSIRAPIPSDWEHAKTLIALSLRKDRKKPKLWALKIFLMPALLMLYTIGFFVGYETDEGGSYIAGNYRLFPGEKWSYPNKINIGAFNNTTFLDAVVKSLSDKSIDIQLLNATSSDEVIANCTGTIADSASNEICIFLSSENEYNLYFGGSETAYPTQQSLAAAQYAINSALLNASNLDEVYQVISKIQETPKLVTKDTAQPALPVILVPSIMYVLSAIICSVFYSGPITNEKMNGIAKSYLLVGVKLRLYLLQWLVYYAMHGIILAGLLTLVCIYFNLMPMSNGFLIYVSNYLGLVHLFAMIILGKICHYLAWQCSCRHIFP